MPIDRYREQPESCALLSRLARIVMFILHSSQDIRDGALSFIRSSSERIQTEPDISG